MNNAIAQQTAAAIQTLAARDDNMRKALRFLAKRIAAMDAHIGFDSAAQAREGGKGIARSTSYMTRSMDNKPRARWSIDSQTWEAA